VSEQSKPAGGAIRVHLARWSGRRVMLLSAGWVVFLLAVTLARVVRAAHAYQRAHPGEDTYLIGYGVPGGLWGLIGPPLVLIAVWVWARLASRPAT
jgi:hypothetical protein